MRLSHTANDAARAIVRHIESLPGHAALPMTDAVKITAVVQIAMNSVKKAKPRLRYFEIYSPRIKEVIGLCTNEGIADAERDDPGVTFRRISRQKFQDAQ